MIVVPIMKELPMLGSESQRLNRTSRVWSISELIFKTYPVVSNGKLDKTKYIAEFNSNGNMLQGGHSRGKDTINNWNGAQVKFMMENGLDSDTHGNFYFKGKKTVNRAELTEIEGIGMRLLMKLYKLK
jgi:hypothetical protein